LLTTTAIAPRPRFNLGPTAPVYDVLDCLSGPWPLMDAAVVNRDNDFDHFTGLRGTRLSW
jgi:hypothetical protein